MFYFSNFKKQLALWLFFRRERPAIIFSFILHSYLCLGPTMLKKHFLYFVLFDACTVINGYINKDYCPIWNAKPCFSKNNGAITKTL